MKTPWQTWRILPALLLAAGVFTCLFSLFLPASASLLAPTATATATVTFTPVPTRTPAPTFSPLPADLITPGVAPFPGYTMFVKRELWEQVVSEPFLAEDFEQEGNTYGSIDLPYLTGNKFLLSGNGYAELINSTTLLPSGRYIHVRDWEQGLTVAFPSGTAVTAFSFDYTSPEAWVLRFNNVEFTLPSGTNQFVGIVLPGDSTTEFTLSSSAELQGGVSVDNIAYTTFVLPSSPTMASTSASSLAPLAPTEVAPNLADSSHTEYFVRDMWEETVKAAIVTEDFETEMAGPQELALPYKTGNGFVLDGNGVAQILNAPEQLSSGNLLHVRAWGQGLTVVFPESKTVAAFGFDYTSSEDWKLTINHFDVYLPSGKDKFIGILLYQNVTLRFTLSSGEAAQGGLSIDNLSYVP